MSDMTTYNDKESSLITYEFLGNSEPAFTLEIAKHSVNYAEERIYLNVEQIENLRNELTRFLVRYSLKGE